MFDQDMTCSKVFKKIDPRGTYGKLHIFSSDMDLMYILDHVLGPTRLPYDNVFEPLRQAMKWNRYCERYDVRETETL